MAAITVGTLASKLAKELDVTEDQYKARDYLAKVETWFNRAYKDVLGLRRWAFKYVTETFDTVAGTKEYKLQTSASRIIAAAIGTASRVEGPLHYTTPKELIHYNFDLLESGSPTHFYESGFDAATQQIKITLFPIPNKVERVYVYEELMAVDLASGAIIPVPNEIIHVLEYATLSEMYSEDGDSEQAQKKTAQYVAALKAAMIDDGMKEADVSEKEYKDVPPGVSTFPIKLPRNYPRFG